MANGGLKELHTASGGAWGGTTVDEEFYTMIIKIIGAPVWSKFKDENTADYHDLQRELEKKKRMITSESTGSITMKVPIKLWHIYEPDSGETIDEAIDGSIFKGKIKWLSDKLRIDAQVFLDFFGPCTEQIVAHVKRLLQVPQVMDTKKFIMVGGFSESAVLQNAVMNAFPDCEVISPDEAGICVVKGAVIYGQRMLSCRVARYSFGINISPLFDSTIHKEDYRFSVEGVDRCRDIFKWYIQKGESVGLEETRSGIHVALNAKQKTMILKIFQSTNFEPKFVDEDDCKYLGEVAVELPKSNDNVRVNVRMMIVENKLYLEAQVVSPHMKYRTDFDFQ